MNVNNVTIHRALVDETWVESDVAGKHFIAARRGGIPPDRAFHSFAIPVEIAVTGRTLVFAECRARHGLNDLPVVANDDMLVAGDNEWRQRVAAGGSPTPIQDARLTDVRNSYVQYALGSWAAGQLGSWAAGELGSDAATQSTENNLNRSMRMCGVFAG